MTKLSIAERMAVREQRLREEAAAYGRLYGKLLPDVEFLRRRGFVIVKERGKLTIGGREVSADDLQAKAARERRLLAAAPASGTRAAAHTVNGHKGGDTVAVSKPRPVSAEARRVLSPVKEKALAGAALAAKRKADETSADLGPAPRMEWLPIGALEVDRRYQRQMGPDNWKHVNRIAREFTWLYYQPIVVAPKSGAGNATRNAMGGGAAYVVIDGQHRLEAARKHPLIETLPCYVVDAGDVARQAQAFVALNARRIGVTRLQRFWAAHAAGEPVALKIHRICTAAGVTITRSGGVLPPCTTIATYTIERLLPLGAATITAALQVLGETHGDRPDAFKSAPIFALVQLAARPGFDRARLVRVMRRADLDRLAGAAKSWRAENGGPLERALERELTKLYEAEGRGGR